MLPELLEQLLRISALACVSLGSDAVPTEARFRRIWHLQGETSLAVAAPHYEAFRRSAEIFLPGAPDDYGTWSRMSYAERAVAEHHIDQGDWRTALAVCSTGLKHPQSNMQRAELFSARAKAKLKAGLSRPAQRDSEQAVRLVADFNPETFKRAPYVTAHRTLASCYQSCGLPERVIETLKDLLATELPKPMEPYERAICMNGIGTALGEMFHSGERESPEAALQQFAQALAVEGILRIDRFTALTRSAELLQSSGRWKEAEDFLSRAADLELEARTAGNPLPLTGRAWFAGLRSRGARLAGAPPPQDLEAVHQEVLQAWAQSPADAGEGYLRYGRSRLALSEVLHARLPTQGPEGALEELLQAECRGSLLKQVGGAPLSLADLRAQLLSKGQGCLAFLPGKQDFHVFAFDQEQVFHHLVLGRESMKNQVQALRRAMDRFASDPTSSSWAESVEQPANVLARRLLGPEILERMATWKSAILVGREMVFDPPVELLPVAGEAAGLRLALSDAPSFAVLAELHRKQQRRASEQGQPDRSARVLCAPELSSEAIELDPKIGRIPPLTGEQLEDLYPLSVQSAQAAEATLSSLFTGSTPTITHIVSHGLRDPNEMGGGFAVTPDPLCPTGVLSADDVRGMEHVRASPLVLLTTCYGTEGDVLLGDAAATHMGGAFLARGAEAVVLSHASSAVRLRPSLDYARALQDALRRGESLDEAARLARRHLAEVAGPAGLAYGAQWMILGLGSWRWGDPTELREPRSSGWVWVLALGTVAAIAFGAQRRLRSTAGGTACSLPSQDHRS